MFQTVIAPQTARTMPARVPAPSHRHGAPSGPWPFLDIDDEVRRLYIFSSIDFDENEKVDPNRIEDPESHRPMSASPCNHIKTVNQEFCWCKYPQAFFPNWTSRQQKKSRISRVIDKSTGLCKVFYVDVKSDGTFLSVPTREVDESGLDTHWHTIQRRRPDGVRVRALFVDNLTGPVLQMLGARYNIEPFFFSSSLGWIPSRYQSNVVPAEGDHITITLTFVRSIQNPTTALPSPRSSYASTFTQRARKPPNLIIDTQAPLPLRSSDLVLLSDLLAVHMVRSHTSNTIISYHPGHDHRTTTAEVLHDRFNLTGKSVYWSSMFKNTTDPTFLFLSLLWYALYSWDEALESLYRHICFLESEVIVTNDLHLTQELHAIRAHLLHYESLLDDFRKTVVFVQQTPNPGLDNPVAYPLDVKELSHVQMKKECENLLREIDRLEASRRMQDKRLKNVMDLGFSIVNIEDSKRMQKLTEAAVRDSAAMKQVAYLTMVFLPASFTAAVFGMNVGEINPGSYMSLAKYFAVAFPLTAVTIWIVVAYQIQIEDPRETLLMEEEGRRNRASGLPDNSNSGAGEARRMAAARKFRKLGMWSRFMWPVVLLSSVFERRKLLEQARKTPLATRYLQ